MLFVLHAAMLAGGAHSTHSTLASAQTHDAMQMDSVAGSEQQPNALSIESPEMAGCMLLGTAVLRFQALLVDALITLSLILAAALGTTALKYAPVVTRVSRAWLQVFLI